MEPTIKAPKNPTALALADAIRGLDRRTKGSPFNLLVPNSLGHMLSRWGYGEGTSMTEKGMAALDVGPSDVAKAIFVAAKLPAEKALASALAKKLDAGADPAALWRETGWGRMPGTDKMVREIDDSAMKTKPGNFKPGESYKATDLVDHPEYFKYVPDAENTMVKLTPNRGALIRTKSNTMEVGADSEFMDNFIHEGEHLAQSRMGRPEGTNPENFGYDIAVSNMKKIEEAIKKRVFKARQEGTIPMGDGPVNMRQAPDLFTDPTDKKLMAKHLANWDFYKDAKNSAIKEYMDTHGEAMARLAAKRRGLSAGERMEDYPFDPNYFERLTGSKLDELTDTGGGGVSKAFVLDNMDARGMTPDMYDFNRKPDYFRENKGIDIFTQDMPIEDYLREASTLNSKASGVSADEILASRRMNKEQIQGIADELRKGTDYAAPYLDYRAGREGQEGFHRTLAAELLGMKTVPVQIRKDLKR